MKRFFLRAGRLWCAGLALFLLRLAQNRTGFDPATGLALPSLAGTALAAAVAACAAVEFILFLRLPKGKAAYAGQFAPPERETLPAAAGGLLLAGGGVLLILGALPSWTLVDLGTGLLGAAAGAGFLLLVRKARAGEELTVAPLLPPLFFSVCFLLTIYLPAESDPVLARFYIPVLAAALTSYAFSQLAAFLRKEGSPRSFVFTGDMAVALCLAALADGGGLGQVLLFAGCAVLLTVFLLLRRDAPLPEPEEDPAP